jgi:hypothetical protein
MARHLAGKMIIKEIFRGIFYCRKIYGFCTTGVQRKNNEYHIVDKVQNSFIDALIFDLIDNVVFVVFALYSRLTH